MDPKVPRRAPVQLELHGPSAGPSRPPRATGLFFPTVDGPGTVGKNSPVGSRRCVGPPGPCPACSYGAAARRPAARQRWGRAGGLQAKGKERVLLRPSMVERVAIDRWFHHHLIVILIPMRSLLAHHLGGQHTDRQTVCVSAGVSVCLPACLSVCLSVCMSVCLFVCLSVYLPVCLHSAPSAAGPQRPCARQTCAQQGRARRGEEGGSRGEIDCKKEELEVPMGTARLVPSTSTCSAPFWTRAHAL